MTCIAMRKAMEVKLGRKLNDKEKEELMRQEGHTEEEIAAELGMVLV